VAQAGRCGLGRAQGRELGSGPVRRPHPAAAPNQRPDILASDFDAEGVARSLRAEPHRTLGDALLDQTLVAGIGNIFKSEACFAARLDPWQPIGELTGEQLIQVCEGAHELMRDAVEHGRHANAVYRRAGQPCPTCGTRILSRGQGDANRTTYWCPSCQP